MWWRPTEAGQTDGSHADLLAHHAERPARLVDDDRCARAPATHRGQLAL